MPSRQRRTVQHLDNLDDHAAADAELIGVVLGAVTDGIIEPHERAGIDAAIARMRTTLASCVRDGEQLHGALTIASALIYTGEITPKIERRFLESTRDLRTIGALV